MKPVLGVALLAFCYFSFFETPVCLALDGSEETQKTSVQDTTNCLYNDSHFHVQDFKAEGPRLSVITKMMDNHVCRSILVVLPVTVAHDPLIDRDFAPVYYTQTDGQVLYYNAIQDVVLAHKVLALPEAERARVDP